MPAKKMDACERKALEDGGNKGGAYLDSLGRTDLAALSEFEYQEYLRQVLTGYSGSMRTMFERGGV